MTRGTQEAFAKALGGQVVIKNVPGAAGTIGAAEAASAARPGRYSVLVTPIGPMVLQPHRMKLTYEPASFAPICKMVDSPIVMMSPPNSPLKTVADVVARAKADGGKLAYGSTGPGTIPHISMLGLAKAAGIPLKHVPYKGSLMSCRHSLRVLWSCSPTSPTSCRNTTSRPSPSSPRSASLRTRIRRTVKESGYDLTFSIWNAMFAPKGTPEAVLAKLEASCKSALADTGTIDALDKQKQPIDYRDRAGAETFVDAEFEKPADFCRMRA